MRLLIHICRVHAVLVVHFLAAQGRGKGTGDDHVFVFATVEVMLIVLVEQIDGARGQVIDLAVIQGFDLAATGNAGFCWCSGDGV